MNEAIELNKKHLQGFLFYIQDYDPSTQEGSNAHFLIFAYNQKQAVIKLKENKDFQKYIHGNATEKIELVDIEHVIEMWDQDVYILNGDWYN